MLTLIATIAAAAAQPSITYLTCESVENGESLHYNITLNESTGIADWENGVGYGRRRDAAQFSAASVSFLDITISRTNLSMQRSYFGHVWSGQCQIATPPKRAF